jgi:hypothetical protein
VAYNVSVWHFQVGDKKSVCHSDEGGIGPARAGKYGLAGKSPPDSSLRRNDKNAIHQNVKQFQCSLFAIN